MPNESNVRQLLDHGVPIYPLTDKSLVLGLQDVPFEYYVVAWDGASTPVPANIPAGVVVTYNGTDYTGTLAAGSATAPYLYLVASASQPGEYDRYITTHPGSSYVWTPLGSTAPVSPVIADDLVTNDSSKALSAKQGKILNDKTSELEAKVTNLELPSGSYTQAQARVYNHPEEWCFLLNQPGTGIRKPIWHIGNGVFIDATGAVISFDVVTPATPTFSPDGGAVAEGTVVTLACATPDVDIYVSTDDGETYTKTSTVTISEAVTLMAYSELEGIRSAVVSKAFTIAVDHRFKFTMKLDQDNATVYVPVAAGTIYTMEVDWGDGSTPDTYNNQLIGLKNCKHIYSGLAGDTFQITLRGSAIPKLYFWQQICFTQAQLYSIDDNTLDVATDYSQPSGQISLAGCTNLVSLSDNAFSNATTKNGIRLQNCSSLPTLSVGLLSMFAEGGISNVESMFGGCTALELSSAFMASLKTKLSSAIISVYGMFYNCKGNITIPDNFLDNLSANTVIDFRNLAYATGVYGDAKALYDVLVTKATSSAQTANCFAGENLSNRNQVPTAWGGTM